MKKAGRIIVSLRLIDKDLNLSISSALMCKDPAPNAAYYLADLALLGFGRDTLLAAAIAGRGYDEVPAPDLWFLRSIGLHDHVH